MFARTAALGLLVGAGASACMVDINGGAHYCLATYEDCRDEGFDRQRCEDQYHTCVADFDGGDRDDCDDDGHGDDGHGDDGHGDDGHGDDGDDSDDLPPRSDGPDPDPDPDQACFDIHATCIAEAESLQDVAACEALFDNCTHPGPCDQPECEDEPGCPQADLDACVEDYSACSASADSPEAIAACAMAFDGCIADFDVEACLPSHDDDHVAVCLAQHELCVSCAPNDDALEACKAAFDTCLEVAPV